MMDNENLIKLIQDSLDKTDLKNKLNGYKLFMFGSRANNSNLERSDIDIGILGEKKLPANIFFELESTFEELPTLLKIDLVDFANVTEDFKKQALQEMKVIYE